MNNFKELFNKKPISYTKSVKQGFMNKTTHMMKGDYKRTMFFIN